MLMINQNEMVPLANQKLRQVININVTNDINGENICISKTELFCYIVFCFSFFLCSKTQC